MTKEQLRGLRLGMQVARTGLDHAAQAIRDVQAMIDVFLKKLDEDKGGLAATSVILLWRLDSDQYGTEKLVGVFATEAAMEFYLRRHKVVAPRWEAREVRTEAQRAPAV